MRRALSAGGAYAVLAVKAALVAGIYFLATEVGRLDATGAHRAANSAQAIAVVLAIVLLGLWVHDTERARHLTDERDAAEALAERRRRHAAHAQFARTEAERQLDHEPVPVAAGHRRRYRRPTGSPR